VNGGVGQFNRFDSKNCYTNIIASGKSIQLNGHISANKLSSFISIIKDSKY
jgi:hypothetical protein